MSAQESSDLFARRSQFESALARISPNASLCSHTDEIPWEALSDLYAAADGVRGVGLAKLTKFLHKKRPELIPMLDSVVEGYLRSVGPIPLRSEGLGIVGDALTRSYKTDLDANLSTVGSVKAALAEHGYELTECRVMDIFTWAYTGDAAPPWVASLGETPLAPDEVRELALDVGITPEGDARTALEAVLAALGYVRARRVLRGWRGESP